MSRIAFFAVLAGFAVLAACSSTPVFDLAQFAEELREREITPELISDGNSSVLGRDGTVVSWADVSVGAFDYPDRDSAVAAAELIADDGSTVEGITDSPINWPGTPHFFRKGRLIVLYVGDDRPTADLLKQILGPQIAGGHGVPEDES